MINQQRKKTIIYLQNFFSQKQNKGNWNRYVINGFYLKYITRDGACTKFATKDQKIIFNSLNELRCANDDTAFLNQKLKEKVFVKHSGLYMNNRFLSEIELNNLIKEQKKLNKKQLFWTSIFSFDEKFLFSDKGFNPEKILQLATKQVKNYLTKNYLDPEKMIIGMSLHIDTDNPHIHLFFYEKEPSKVNCKNQTYYSQKGIFQPKTIELLKSNLVQAIYLNQQNSYLIASKKRDEILNLMQDNNQALLKKAEDAYSGGEHLLNNLFYCFETKANLTTLKLHANKLVKYLIENSQNLNRLYADMITFFQKTDLDLNYLTKDFKLNLETAWFKKSQMDNKRYGINVRMTNLMLKIVKNYWIEQKLSQPFLFSKKTDSFSNIKMHKPSKLIFFLNQIIFNLTQVDHMTNKIQKEFEWNQTKHKPRQSNLIYQQNKGK